MNFFLYLFCFSPNHLTLISFKTLDRFMIHSFVQNRYPIDQYDRIWDTDSNFKPFHVSSGFKVEANFDSIDHVKEAPPAVVVETARVLARRDELSYNLPLEEQGDYFLILYFGGILAVHPSFDVLINGKVVESNYTVEMGEMRALYVIQEQIKSLNITLKSVKFYPQVNALEVYQIVHVPLEASSTTGVCYLRFEFIRSRILFKCGIRDLNL